MEDADYRSHVQQAVRLGLDAADRGELVDQEAIEQRMRRWLERKAPLIITDDRD